MVFNGSTFINIIFVLSIVWIVALTVIVFRMIHHYNQLTSGITKTGLKDILESMMVKDTNAAKHIGDIEKAVREIRDDGTLHIQRLGIVRFNPFSDTGGSQSFSLALLDARENGIVITSLYARTGNRWYVKEVHAGKGRELELSKEEELAIKKAHQYE